jgi:S-DNA-T family DNA segregation ATPase FtsK/SpoIIIE
MRAQLELQANRIETLLRMHNVRARVCGGTVTPRWIRFQVLPALGARISKIKHLNEELAAALNTTNCRVARRGASLDVEIPRDDPKPVRFLPLYRRIDAQDIPPATAILGLADDGHPLLIRLPSPDVAHILVAGTTGSGKTVLLQTIILSLALYNQPGMVQMILIDPKRSAFEVFDSLPHLTLATDRATDDPARTLQTLVSIMEDRGGEIPLDEPRLVLIIDELIDILMTSDEAMPPLTRLLQRGREAGIHVIAATQKPSSAVIGSLNKANFPVRLVGRVTSATDARVASGWSGTGAERLEGRGDFIAIAEGQLTRFQTPYISPDEVQEVINDDLQALL